MKYWLTILCIIIISYPLVAQEDVKTTKTPVIESSPNVEARYPGGRIELFGIKFKDPLVLCQILIALMMTIAFIQSGLDKLIDRKGNLEFFKSHFAHTPLKSVSDVGLSILTILELMGGAMCAYGIYCAIVENSTVWIFNGLLLLAVTILILFLGQRIAKDYQGAADLVPYFILNMMDIMIMYYTLSEF